MEEDVEKLRSLELGLLTPEAPFFRLELWNRICTKAIYKLQIRD